MRPPHRVRVHTELQQYSYDGRICAFTGLWKTIGQQSPIPASERTRPTTIRHYEMGGRAVVGESDLTGDWNFDAFLWTKERVRMIVRAMLAAVDTPLRSTA